MGATHKILLTILAQDFRTVEAMSLDAALATFSRETKFNVGSGWEIDNKFPLVLASVGFLKLTGYSKQQVVGQHCGTLMKAPEHNVQWSKDLVNKEFDDVQAGKTQFGACLAVNERSDGTLFLNFHYLAMLETVVSQEDPFGRKLA